MQNLVSRSRWVALAASLGLAFACSSSTSPSGATAADGGAPDAATTSGDDAAMGDDGPGVEGTQCGSAPYVTLGMTVTAASTSGTSTPIQGARFTSPLCPGVFATSDANGNITGSIAKDTPFYARFDATNYASQLSPEQTYSSDTSGISVELLPSLFTAIISGYDATKGTIFVGAFADNGHDGGSDPCDALDGISFAVVGHPEYAPTYYSTDTIPAPVTGTSTTASGRASFAGVALGTTYTLSATKAGCDVTFVHAPDTGRVPVEASYVTLIGAYSHDADGGAPNDAAPE